MQPWGFRRRHVASDIHAGARRNSECGLGLTATLDYDDVRHSAYGRRIRGLSVRICCCERCRPNYRSRMIGGDDDYGQTRL